jgi:Peptidase family M23
MFGFTSKTIVHPLSPDHAYMGQKTVMGQKTGFPISSKSAEMCETVETRHDCQPSRRSGASPSWRKLAELRMLKKSLNVAASFAMISGTWAETYESHACKPCLRYVVAEARDIHTVESSLKGYHIASTGLQPSYPNDYACPRLTSLYASWIDVDRTRRKQRHSGVDAGRLGDSVLAPAPAKVRRVWVADWGEGHEGAVLLLHTREDLNLADGPKYYYSEFDHLKYSDVSNLKEGQRIERGQLIGYVFRPGGKTIYLPEVHFEVYEVDDDTALAWKMNTRGTEFFINPKSRLIDPLYLMSLEVRPNAHLEVPIQPFELKRDYSGFKGFTYILACRKQSQR